MGKYGKKNEISLNPLDYNICLLGESKIGKTTIAKEICEKLVGEDGYIHFDIGKEEGAYAIENIVSEQIEDWTKLSEVVDDIIENKATDYPDLKVIIWDTLDELILLAEAESLRLYNRKNPDKKVDTIDAAWGGFKRGQDKACEMILDTIWNLKKVGISSMIIGHVKKSDLTDPITQETYSKITADTTQRYFNAIKNKMHFVGLAYIDRDIVKEKTGRKNVVTKQEVTINKVVKESRVISFRDDTYSVDSGSRFAEIIDRIPFDADEFIKAMKDAIMAEKKKSGKSDKEIKKEQEARETAKEQAAIKASEDAKKNKIDAERNEELKGIIKERFLALDKESRTVFKNKMTEVGVDGFTDVSETPTVALETLIDFLDNM